VPAFRVKLSANDLNYVDVRLNPTHSLTHLCTLLKLLDRTDMPFGRDTRVVLSAVTLCLTGPWSSTGRRDLGGQNPVNTWIANCDQAVTAQFSSVQ